MYPLIRMNGLNTLVDEDDAAPAHTADGIFDRLAVLSDQVRCRALAILERDELTVSELCRVLQLPQSTTSRHLKTLVGDGWVVGRRDGTSRRYVARARSQDSPAGALWRVVRDEIMRTGAASDDLQRLRAVLAERHRKSQEYFSTAAAQWSEVRRNLFGDDFDRIALLALLDREWTVGDLGTGSGQMSLHLAPFVGRVIAVDESDAMLETARARLADEPNVNVRRGRLEALPIEDDELDVATLVLVLHHLPDPAAAIAEAGRCIRPGGRILIVDMLPHDRDEYRQSMGHVWLGFDPGRIEQWLEAASFERPTVRPLPADTQARGPALFAATAVKRPG